MHRKTTALVVVLIVNAAWMFLGKVANASFFWGLAWWNIACLISCLLWYQISVVVFHRETNKGRIPKYTVTDIRNGFLLLSFGFVPLLLVLNLISLLVRYS